MYNMKKYKTKYKYKNLLDINDFYHYFKICTERHIICNVILAGGKGHELVNVVMWSND